MNKKKKLAPSHKVTADDFAESGSLDPEKNGYGIIEHPDQQIIKAELTEQSSDINNSNKFGD